MEKSRRCYFQKSTVTKALSSWAPVPYASCYREEDPPPSLLCQSRGRMLHAGSVRVAVIGRQFTESPADRRLQAQHNNQPLRRVHHHAKCIVTRSKKEKETEDRREITSTSENTGGEAATASEKSSENIQISFSFPHLCLK